MRDQAVVNSPIEIPEYSVLYDLKDETAGILDFKGICMNRGFEDRAECRWEATCGDADSVVVRFHNGV